MPQIRPAVLTTRRVFFVRGAGEWRLQKLRVPRDWMQRDEFTIEKNIEKTMEKP